MKMPSICFDVIPHKKSNAADDDQQHNYDINDRVFAKITQRDIGGTFPHQVKSGITKGRNGMKNTVPNAFYRSKCRNKAEG